MEQRASLYAPGAFLQRSSLPKWPYSHRVLCQIMENTSLGWFFVGTSAAAAFWVLIGAFYRLYFHPLSSVPGPKLAAFTFWYEVYYDLIQSAQFPWKIVDLHEKYGKRRNTHSKHQATKLLLIISRAHRSYISKRSTHLRRLIRKHTFLK